MLKVIGVFIAVLVLFNETSADDLIDYSKIYHKQCATCHGDRGDGRGRAGASLLPTPTNFTSEESKRKLSINALIHSIKKGVPGSSMVGYERRFNDQVVRGLAAYIQEEFMGVVKTVSTPSADDNLGKQLYAKNCSACHGDNGNTAVWAKNGLNPPPRNFAESDPLNELTRERMTASVTYGRPGTAMMPFSSRLSSEEIDAVVAYIRRNFMGQGAKVVVEDNSHVNVNQSPQINNQMPSHAQVDMSLPFENGLQGNIEPGKNFYQNNCYECHGRLGDGNGPRASFNTPRPRNFTTAESRFLFNRPRLFQGISKGKRGTVMPAWSTVLSDQEIANVAEYVFQVFILSEKKKPL